MYLAHSANDVGNTHPLKVHLASVSRLARKFLEGHPAADEAELAGLLHDLGKYGDMFGAWLQGEMHRYDRWHQKRNRSGFETGSRIEVTIEIFQ